MEEIKRELRTKAYIVKGLTNLLRKDADYISEDAAEYDLVGLGESVREIKVTIQSLIDHIEDIEYLLYDVKRYI